MKRRVVVTGLGAVTSLGVGVERSWTRLCAGESGVSRITLFDASNTRVQVAGQVKDFNPGDFLDRKQVHRTGRYQSFAIAAAEMALKDAAFSIGEQNADRVGVVIANAVAGMPSLLNAHDMYSNGARADMSPFFVLEYLGNMAAGLVAIRFGARGPNYSPCTACAAGTHAVGEAFKIVQRGDADAIIAGGAEAAITPVLLHGLGLMRACSSQTDPSKACRPFDLNRDGFVPGEGAGILILEELRHAESRGARIYSEVAGYAATADAFHVTSPPPNGEGAARCMRLALADAGVAPDQVGYINAHGTSTKINDATETRAIKSTFGDHALKLPLSSNKSMLGHSWGASGAIEAVFTCLTLRDGVMPPTINLETPDPECDLDYIPNKARKAELDVAVSNSFGFGGTNGVLVIKKFRHK